MATFGYAVVTTACGMFLRLALTQFSYSTDVQILDTREQVQRGLQGLVDSLTSASQTIQAFEDLAARSQQQWETDVRTRMEKTIFLTASQAERIAEVFTATGNALAASMGDTGEALKAASKEVRIAGKKIVVDLATVGESVSTAAGAFGGSSKAIGQSAAVLSAELQRLAASVGPSLSASIAATNLLDNLAGLSEDTMAFRSSATALLGGLRDVENALPDVLNATNDLKLMIERLRMGIDQSGDRLVRSSSDVAQKVEEILPHVEGATHELGHAVKQFLFGIEQSGNRVVGSANTIAQRVDSLHSQLDTSADKVDQAVEDVVEFLRRRV
jgi:ABC-type transporter Mla subunit MlaD